MKTIIFNITHDEVFEDIKKILPDIESKHASIVETEDNITVNMTGTLEELESE